jgi:hypothetical protein
MSTTISDVITPEVYASYTTEPSIELNELYKSGVIVTSELIQSLANSGGDLVTMPLWLDISKTEPNISGDDESVYATGLTQTAVKQTARIARLNQVWTASDLSAEVAGSDAITSVKNRLYTYWSEQMQRRLISTISGLVADSIANHSGDLLQDDTGSAFSATGFLTAAQTLGDHKSSLRALVVHSAVQTLMSKLDLIEYIQDSAGYLTLPTYKGLQLIVDDQVSNDGTTYDCYLVGAGAFGTAMGTPKLALEVERKGTAANGGGVENLISRTSPIIHPFGYKFTDTTVAAESPAVAELALAVNWTRVLASRKSIPFAVYRCALVTTAV